MLRSLARFRYFSSLSAASFQLPVTANVVQVTRFGPPDVLKEVAVSLPHEVDVDEVLVKAFASGVNPVDAKIRSGAWNFFFRQPLPAVLGKEAAGVVVRAGANVKRVREGDAVCGLLHGERTGTYAEFCMFKEKEVCQMPSNIDFVQAASVPFAGVTALQSLRTTAAVDVNQNVLVIGCGGVGALAVQIARCLGAKATVVCSENEANFARSVGVEDVVDYAKNKFWDVLDPKFDVVLHTAGGRDTLEGAFRVLKPTGTVVTLEGPSDSNKATLTNSLKFGADLIAKNAKHLLHRSGVLLLHHTLPTQSDLEQVLRWVADGEVKPAVRNVRSLSDVVEVHRLLEEGKLSGKTVLINIRKPQAQHTCEKEKDKEEKSETKSSNEHKNIEIKFK